MKKITLLTFIVLLNSNIYAEENNKNCASALAKLKPKCNVIGSGVKKLKEFSSKNKTIEQTLGIEKDKKKTLKEFSKENKTIDQTYRNIKEKLKKKNDN